MYGDLNTEYYVFGLRIDTDEGARGGSGAGEGMVCTRRDHVGGQGPESVKN